MTDQIESRDVIYVHSPITYSIGRHLLRHGIIKNPLIICGRKIHWDGSHIDVIDDGVWDIQRTCDFLEKLCGQLSVGRRFQLNMYLPHTGFLLGKLLKLAAAVHSIRYIEEGDTSCDPALSAATPNFSISVADLAAELKRRGLLEKLQIREESLEKINAMDVLWFDKTHPKYAGAYGISAQAFPGMAQVALLHLDRVPIIPEGERVWVCLLPSITNMAIQHKNNMPLLSNLTYGLVMMLRTTNAIVRDFGGWLLIKFHPTDEAKLDEDFKQELYRYGSSYREFFELNNFDINYEPALYNFDRFVVVNTSAASRYIEQLQGKEKLINIKLD